MRAVYLTGEHVYLRALRADDAEHAAAWFDSPFPINATRAEEWLKEQHREQWSRTRYYVIARTDDDAIVGGITMQTDNRKGGLFFHMAPWLPDADNLRAEALRLLIPWMRDDLELMTAVVHLAADETETIHAAEELGMEPNVRLREWFARPGGRVDAFIYQALNAPWEARDA